MRRGHSDRLNVGLRYRKPIEGSIAVSFLKRLVKEFGCAWESVEITLSMLRVLAGDPRRSFRRRVIS